MIRKNWYYMLSYISLIIPNVIVNFYYRHMLNSLRIDEVIENRIKYYLGSPSRWDISNIGNWITIKKFKKIQRKTYFLDLFKYIRIFSDDLCILYKFGDITTCQGQPTIVKSRPIAKCNCSVLFKLNEVRHFNFIKDPYEYREKNDIMVWRGGAYQDQRIRFLKAFFDHPLCDVGHVAKSTSLGFYDKPFMSIDNQLNNKFIFSIEGNDVATNLKWVMSSNSVCVMPRPRYETWFMEGRLVPGFHYVEVQDDYSDLIEKLEYYLKHEEESLQIIKNANMHVALFTNKKIEIALSILVLERYFEHTKQLS